MIQASSRSVRIVAAEFVHLLVGDQAASGGKWVESVQRLWLGNAPSGVARRKRLPQQFGHHLAGGLVFTPRALFGGLQHVVVAGNSRKIYRCLSRGRIWHAYGRRQR